jgi:glutamate dehydrogenase
VGLTAPELAVLLAYTKLELQRALVVSDVPDDAYLHDALVRYFPGDLRSGYEPAIATHPLRREIVATVVANAVVNRAGISFLSRLSDETATPLPVLARAHVVARDVFDAGALWAEIDALDLVVPAAVQDEMFLAVRRLVERASRWLVQHAGELPLGPTIDRFRPGVQQVVAELPQLVGGDGFGDGLQQAGVPRELARRVGVSDAAVVALPAVELGERNGVAPVTVARVQFAVDERLQLAAVRERIAALPRGDRWQTEARAALRDDFYESVHALTGAVLRETDAASPAGPRVDAWVAAHASAVERYRALADDVERAGVFDLATLAVLRRALRELAELD